jgi:hypothetical protein
MVETIFLVDGFAWGRWKVEQRGASPGSGIGFFFSLSAVAQNLVSASRLGPAQRRPVIWDKWGLPAQKKGKRS